MDERKGIEMLTCMFKDDPEELQRAIKSMEHAKDCETCHKIIKEFEEKIIKHIKEEGN